MIEICKSKIKSAIDVKEIYSGMLDSISQWDVIKDVAPMSAAKHADQIDEYLIDLINLNTSDLWFFLGKGCTIGRCLRIKRFNHLRRSVIQTLSLSVVVQGR